MRLEFGSPKVDHIGRDLKRGVFCQWPGCTAWGPRELRRPAEWRPGGSNVGPRKDIWIALCADHREEFINLPVPKKRNMKMEGRRRWEPRGALAPSPNGANLNTS